MLSGPCLSQCICHNSVCHDELQNEYELLIDCLKDADASLPRYKPGTEKDWWTSDLSALRHKSIDIHNLWISEGRPRQGLIHEERLRVRAAYKRSIRAAQRSSKQQSRNQMHSALRESDTNSFWRSWKSLYNKNKSSLAPVVNGCSSKPAIAECFKETFQRNSVPNNAENVKKLDERFSFTYREYLDKHNASCDCKSQYVTTFDVIDALGNMKCGKSADESSITAEHLHYAPLNFLIRLTQLFNLMLKYSFVPKEFRSGFMKPILKDLHGNCSIMTVVNVLAYTSSKAPLLFLPKDGTSESRVSSDHKTD